jgi:hypothetical protein
MVQQVIDVGTVANDRTGDTWRDAMIKANENFTEVFDDIAAIGVNFIAQESDFPNQDANNIYIDGYYWITSSFSTAKNFVFTVDGATFTCGSTNGPLVTFTGSGDMFSATDVDAAVIYAHVDAGTGNRAFNFVDTVGGTKQGIMRYTRVETCAAFGYFEDLTFLNIFNCDSAATDGVEIAGTSNFIISIAAFGLVSSSASFKGIDLGSATATVIEFSDLLFVAPAGAYGISGLASNGNVVAGSIATVTGSTFSGGMDALENITVDDVRWLFRNNSPIPDTQPDALLSFTGNAAATTVPGTGAGALVNATWTINATSFYTGTAAGRATYNGERDLRSPIDIAVDVEPSSGTNKLIAVFVAINGTVVASSRRIIRADAGDPKSIPVIWQYTFAENDYVEVFVDNLTDTVSIVVSAGVLRVR